MKLCTLYVCVVALFCLSQAETVNEGIDPAIPRDKCGVSIGVDDKDRAYLFVVDADGVYHYQVEDPTDPIGFSSSSWKSLDGNFKGGPAVVRSNDGRLQVFGRSRDNKIFHKYQADTQDPDTFTTWQDLDHLNDKIKFTSDPVAILSSEGFLHLFAKGADNSLMHKTQFTNNTLYLWTEWTSLGGSLTSQPAVLLDAEGLLHVFVRGPDRALWRKHQIGGQEPRFVKWSEWQSLGGVLASAPRVPIALNTVNLLEIFVRASDKAYWHRTQVASLPPNEVEVDWNEWQSIGGVFSSGPAAAVDGDGMIQTVGRGVDKAIWRKFQFSSDGLPKWSIWESLRGITSTGPAIRVRSDGLIDVFVRGVDKQIWMKRQIHPAVNTTETFTVWKPLGNLLTEAFAC